MQAFDPLVFVAVFQEMMGPLLFWVLAIGAVVVTIAFLFVLIRDRGIIARRFVWSEVLGIAGGFGAVWAMQVITHSGLRDIGGPIDWVLVASIWVMGAVGTTLLAYVALGMIAGRQQV